MLNISTRYKVAAELPTQMIYPYTYFRTKYFPVINANHFYMLLGGS